MKTYLRIGFGVALFAYVFASGMIRWDLLASALTYPLDVLWVQLCFLSIVASQSLRWRLMNTLQANFLPYRRLLQIMLISNFMALFAPASVGADVVRGYYSVSEGSGKTGKSIVAILLDRVLGLVSFVAFTGVFGLLQYASLSTELRILTHSAWALLVLGAVTMLGLRWVSARTIQRLESLPWLNAKNWWVQCVEGLVIGAKSPGTLLTALAVSLVATAMSVLPYWCVATRIGMGLSVIQCFLIVPLGMIASALSMIPFGLGMGQIAFYQLAIWIGASAEDGATLVTIVQAQSVLFSVLCGLVYFKSGGLVKVHEKVTQG